LKDIGQRVHGQTVRGKALAAIGLRQTNAAYFDTLRCEGEDRSSEDQTATEKRGINLCIRAGVVQVSLNETVTEADLADLAAAFGDAAGRSIAIASAGGSDSALSPALTRKSAYLSHPVFNSHHSETEMMRYIRSLERKDIGLDSAMIPLARTMGLTRCRNDAGRWAEFARSTHLAGRSRGYAQIFNELEAALAG
jgi:glycine dehydrogenase